MPQSFAALHAHLIFSTKQRERHLTLDVVERLYPYFGGIAGNLGCTVKVAGGVEDHVHLLVSLGREVAVSTLVRDLKANSSSWLKNEFPHLAMFAWQNGYGAFSVGRSGLDRVAAYIRNQEEHHRKLTFQEEFVEFLERYGIRYDERYLWD
jgi:REP element-mobilizing transposase RayT